MFKFQKSIDKRNRALYEACLSRDIGKVQSLLQQGADPRVELAAEDIKKLRNQQQRNAFELLLGEMDFLPDDAPFNLGNLRRLQSSPPSCFEYAVHSQDRELLGTFINHCRPVGQLLYKLMLQAVSVRNHDLTSDLLKVGGFSVLDGPLLRQALKKESVPIVETLLSYDEDFTPIFDTVLEFAIENRSVSLLKLFRKHDLTVTPTASQWQSITKTGSADFLREVMLHAKPSPTLTTSLIESALDSRQIECLSTIIGAGLGDLREFKFALQQTRKDNSFKTFLSLATTITEGQTLPQEQWKQHIEKIIGISHSEIKTRGYSEKDLFTYDKEKSFRSLPFVRIALRAAYLATVASEDEVGVARAIMTRMLQQDLARISQTKGLSWARFANAVDQEAALPDHLPDLFRDITDALLLPVWCMDNLTDGLPDSTLAAQRRHFEQFASVLYFEGKDTLTTTLLSRRWLRQVDRIVAEYRPAKAGLEWTPLFEPVELSSGMKVVCLYSTAQLVDEGKFMRHCVGSGGYATGCAEGTKHIISIRNPQNESVATIELASGNFKDTISLGRHGPASVVQFHGPFNREPSKQAQAAWNEFKKLLNEGHIKLSEQVGATEQTKELMKNQRFLRLFGFLPKDAQTVLPQMFNRYASIAHEVKSGYNVPFFAPLVITNVLGKFAKEVQV